jgi:outer membrane protein
LAAYKTGPYSRFVQMASINKILKKALFNVSLVITLILPAEIIRAQEAWSLEACITYALDHNLDVKKQVLAVQGRKDDVLQSKLILLPDLNGGATHGYNWGQTVDRYTNTFATTRVQSNNFYLSSSVMLFAGLKNLNTIKQSQLDLMASHFDLDLIMDNISVAVASFYLDILYNQEILEVAREQLTVTQQQVNRMEKMVQAGTMSKGDLLNLQAQASTEESQVVSAENQLAISYLNLQQLIDLPVSETFRIEKPVLRAIEAPSIRIASEDVYQAALAKRPEIKGAELRLQSADKGISLARSYLSPSLMFNGTWATGYSGQSEEGQNPISSYVPIGISQISHDTVFSLTPYTEYQKYQTVPFRDQLNKNQNKSIGFSLQVPIYNGWQVRTAISKAKIARETADYNLQQTRLTLQKTIQQAYADAVAALKNYNASEKKVEAQQEAFKYAQQKFDVGLMNAVDYNQTKKDLTAAESELLQAKYRYLYTTTLLNFYMGNPLKLD